MRWQLAVIGLLSIYDINVNGWHSTRIGSPISAEYYSTSASTLPSILLTQSSLTLNALSPSDGSVKWRRPLDDPTSTYFTCDRSIYLISQGLVSSLNPSSGHLLWSTALPPPSGSSQPTGICSADNHVVVTSSNSVLRMSSTTGSVTWTWTSPLAILSSATASISPEEETILILTSSTYTLISTSTGLASSSQPLPSTATLSSTYDYILIGSPPTLVYLSSGELQTVSLSPSSPSKAASATSLGTGFSTLYSIPKSNVFVAARGDGTALVLRPSLSKKAAELDTLWTLSDRNGAGALFAGYVDKDGESYVAKMTYSIGLSMGNLQIISLKPSSASPSGMLTAHTFPYNPIVDGELQSFILHLTPPTATSLRPSTLTFITTTSGILKSITGDAVLWTRDEVATGIEDRITPLVIDGEVVGVGGFHGRREGFRERLGRHIGAMTGLILNKRLKEEGNVPSLIHLNKRLIIFISGIFQTVFAVDSVTGEIGWRFVVPEGGVKWEGLEEEEEEDGRRTIRAWGRRGNKGVEYFILDAATGSVLSSHSIPRGKSTFSIQLSEGRTVELVDSGSAVYKLPKSEDPVAPFTWIERVGKGKLVGKSVRGLLEMKPEVAWTFSVPKDSKIGPIAAQKLGVVASLGRVLGDRSTLRKYLNPHLLAAVVYSPTTTSLQILDSSTGQTIHQLNLPQAREAVDIGVVLKDNWVLTSWLTEGGVTRVLSVELFDKSFGEVGVQEKSYLIDAAVKVQGVTRTKLGITGLNVLFTTLNDQIISIPRRFLDPRRPVRNPSKSDMEEGLIPYEAILAIDPRWVLSGSEQVLGPISVTTFPGRRESESLVLATGLDTLTAELSPSRGFDVLSESFNKAQLLVTVSGLASGLFVVRSLVKSRDVRSKWYTVR